MFFDIELLCRRDRGKFSTVWLVATRGIKKVTRQQILQVNTSIVSDEIMQMMTCSSNVPRRRLSLSLSAKLINGLAKIQLAQVNYMGADVLQYLIKIERSLPLDNAVKTPKQTRKPRTKKGPVSSQEVQAIFGNTPEIEVIITDADIMAASVNVARIDEITLREDFPQRSGIYEGTFADGLNQFGELVREDPIFGGIPIEDLLRDPGQSVFGGLPSSTILQETDAVIQNALVPAQPAPQIVVMEVTPLIEETVVPLQPAEEFAIPAPLLGEARGEKRPAASPPALEKLEKVPRSPRTSKRSAQSDEALMPPPKATRSQDWKKMTEGKPLRKPRNRCKKIGDEMPDLTAVTVLPITADLSRLDDIMQYVDEVPTGDYLARAAEPVAAATPSDSLQHHRGRTTSDQLAVSAGVRSVSSIEATTLGMETAAAIETPTTPSPPDEPPTVAEPSLRVEEQLPIDEAAVGISAPMERTEELQPVIPQRSPALVTQSNVKARQELRFNDEERLRGILKKMKRWDFTAAQLTIDDVAEMPLTKRSIAQALGDLCALASKGIIVLKHVPGTKRLGNIEKGRKFPKYKF